MGQYYIPVCLETEEYLCSHDYDNGLKLMEHSWVDNNFVGVVSNLLLKGNLWYKRRLVWCGDYTDDGLYLERCKCDDETENLYGYASNNFKRLGKNLKSKYPKYFINESKKEYVDVEKAKESRYGSVHPLPILTSSGNGNGGGDYHGSNEDMVGIWAGDIIYASMKKTNEFEDYTEIIPDFQEE